MRAVALLTLLATLVMPSVAAAAPAPVVVLPPRVRTAPLFPDEAARLHEAAQKWAVAQADALDIAPVPLAEVREAIAGAPSARDAVAARWPDAGRVYVSASRDCRPRPATKRKAKAGIRFPGAEGGWESPLSCRRAFVLRVTVSVPGDGRRHQIYEGAATVEEAAVPARWTAAFAALQPHDRRVMAILSSRPPTPAGVLVEITDAHVAGDWGDLHGFRRSDRTTAAPALDAGALGEAMRGLSGGTTAGKKKKSPAPKKDRPVARTRKVAKTAKKRTASKKPGLRDLLAPAQEALNGCRVPRKVLDGSADLHETAVLAVAAAGAVTRCAVRGDAGPTRPKHEACVCRAFSALRFPKGDAGRRLVLEMEQRH